MRHFLICAVVIAAAAAVYWPVFGYGFSNFDDDKYILDNDVAVKGLSLNSPREVWSYSKLPMWVPLTVLSFQMDASLSGLDPGWMHGTNLLLHLLNTVLLYLLFVRMTGRIWPSAFIAALFALHPAHVESVVWITERKDVLSTAFWFGATLAYVGFVRNGSRGLYALSVMLFALGMLAKPMLITLPFTLLLLDLWPLNRLNRLSNFRACVAEKIPYFLVVAMFLWTTFRSQAESVAIRSLSDLPLAWRIENVTVSYFTYVWKAIAPVKLAVYYPHPMGSQSLGLVVACAIALIAATGAAFFLYRRAPWFTSGWLWFLGTLVPVVGIVQIGGQGAADRYTYIPYVGLFWIAAWGLARGVEKAPRTVQRLCAAAVASFVLMLALMAAKQVTYWRGDEELFRHALAVTEGNSMAHTKLGEHYKAVDRIDEAVEQFELALDVAPKNHFANTTLAVILLDRNEAGKAIAHLETALERPYEVAASRQRLASAYYNSGNFAEAERVYRLAVTDPQGDEAQMDDAYFWLIRTLEAAGKEADARSMLGKFLVLQPNSSLARFEAGRFAMKDGDSNSALGYFRDSLRMDASNVPAWNHMGVLFGQAGRLEDSIACFRSALDHDEESLEAHQNLATALDMAGQRTEAEEHRKRAAELAASGDRPVPNPAR